MSPNVLISNNIYFLILPFNSCSEYFSAFLLSSMIFFIVITNVETSAINQKVEPFLARALVYILISFSFDKIAKLSNIQYSKKPTLVMTLRIRSVKSRSFLLLSTSNSLESYFKLLNNLNSFLASFIELNNEVVFLAIYLSPFCSYLYLRNRQAYWMDLQNLSRPSVI